MAHAVHSAPGTVAQYTGPLLASSEATHDIPSVMRRLSRTVLATILLGAASCGDPGSREASMPAPPSVEDPTPDDESGMPKLGPGELYNACERIWCLAHEANFALEHFLSGHDGWILHEDGRGDVFVPRRRTASPGFPRARSSVLNLCGRHVHPWILGRRGRPVRRTGYNAALSYSRSHFNAYGTRLEPCCVSGLGWSYVHSASPEQFRFHDTAMYREITGAGWQRPVAPRRSS